MRPDPWSGTSHHQIRAFLPRAASRSVFFTHSFAGFHRRRVGGRPRVACQVFIAHARASIRSRRAHGREHSQKVCHALGLASIPAPSKQLRLGAVLLRRCLVESELGTCAQQCDPSRRRSESQRPRAQSCRTSNRCTFSNNAIGVLDTTLTSSAWKQNELHAGGPTGIYIANARLHGIAPMGRSRIRRGSSALGSDWL